MNDIQYINGEYVITIPILGQPVLFSKDSIHWPKQKTVETSEFRYPCILSFAQHNGIQVALIYERMIM